MKAFSTVETNVPADGIQSVLRTNSDLTQGMWLLIKNNNIKFTSKKKIISPLARFSHVLSIFIDPKTQKYVIEPKRNLNGGGLLLRELPNFSVSFFSVEMVDDFQIVGADDLIDEGARETLLCDTYQLVPLPPNLSMFFKIYRQYIDDYDDLDVVKEICENVKIMENKQRGKSFVRFYPFQQFSTINGQKEFLRDVEITLIKHPTHAEIRFWKAPSQDCDGVLSIQYYPVSLEDIISDRVEISLDVLQMYKIALGVAFGIRWIHGCNHVCRDLRPSSILLDLDTMEPKIAKCRIHHIPSIESDISDLRYRAPEVDEYGYTEKSDAYSFALIMNEMYTHEMAFKSLSDVEALEAAKSGIRPRIANCQISSLIEQCWSKNPEERPDFQTITQQLCNKITRSEYEYIKEILVYESTITNQKSSN